jgi:hypothetical protein
MEAKKNHSIIKYFTYGQLHKSISNNRENSKKDGGVDAVEVAAAMLKRGMEAKKL